MKYINEANVYFLVKDTNSLHLEDKSFSFLGGLTLGTKIVHSCID